MEHTSPTATRTLPGHSANLSGHSAELLGPDHTMEHTSPTAGHSASLSGHSAELLGPDHTMEHTSPSATPNLPGHSASLSGHSAELLCPDHTMQHFPAATPSLHGTDHTMHTPPSVLTPDFSSGDAHSVDLSNLVDLSNGVALSDSSSGAYHAMDLTVGPNGAATPTALAGANNTPTHSTSLTGVEDTNNLTSSDHGEVVSGYIHLQLPN